MKGKKFRKGNYIAKVIQWDDTDALWICQYSWGEFFYEDEEYIRQNLAKE